MAKIFFVAAICAITITVNAQVGPSGIVAPDGKNIQFPHGFADDILLVGPSGIVTKSGKNLQLPASLANIDLASHFKVKRSAPILIGPSAILYADGTSRQFTQAEIDNHVAVGPSGIVTKNGVNEQFRFKRAAPLVGPSGILYADGTSRQFTQAEVDNHVAVGPSGIVTKNGVNEQFRFKRAAAQPIVGPSGIIYPDGRLVQFTAAQADNIALVGPSGIVTKDGKNIQFRRKRQATTNGGSISHAGIHRADGTIELFDHDFAHSIIEIGPSGIITKNGPIQLTSDLKFVNRVRRSEPILGASGMILANGQQIQFSRAGVVPVVDGPSGIIFSDGTVVQKTS